MIVCVCSVAQLCLTATPWTVARQAPPSMGFPRQGHWSALPFPSGDLPDSGIETRDRLLHLLLWQADSLPLSHLEIPPSL